MSSDVADVYARLQRETAKLLALDGDALTPSSESESRHGCRLAA